MSKKSDDEPRVADAAQGARFVHATTVGRVRLIELRLPQVLDSGEIDHVNAALLEELAAHGGGRCVLDLSAVQYMGSSMLGLMVNARQRVKSSGGRLVLCCMSDWLVKTFHTCSLERMFVMATSRSEAMAAVQAN